MTDQALDIAAELGLAADLDDLADQYGVDCPEPSGPCDLKVVPEGSEALDTLAAHCGSEQEVDEMVRCADKADNIDLERDGRPSATEAIGEVGGRIREDDKIRPTVAKYAPWIVRGHHGQDGLYEEYYRTEPHIFQPVNTVTGMLVAGTHTVEMPEEIKPSQESAVREFVDWCNGWLHGVRHSSPGGFRSFVQHAASAQIFGFAIHETTWTTDDQGRWHPDAYLFREQNTVDRWVLDDSESELAATQHRGVGTEGYTLPAGGRHPRDRRVMLSNLHSRGNNFEGISYIRPSIHWIKTKRVLGQILAVAADKYGAPITTIKEDPEFVRNAEDIDAESLYDIFASMRAVEGAVATVPAGLDVDIKSPSGTMPTLGDMMQYCDQMISFPWQNQGSTLSSGTVGSYALSKVEDQKFVRAVPPIHQSIMRPVNDQIRYLAQNYLEDRISGELLSYPEVGFHLDHVTDTSSWVDDMVALMGKKPLPEWPEELQERALEKMGMESDMLQGTTEAAPGGVDNPEEAQ